MRYRVCIENHISCIDRIIEFNEKLHFLEGPAVSSTDGYIGYYINGEIHRNIYQGPARLWVNKKTKLATVEFWKNGEFIRTEYNYIYK